jgi:hypothetical protein
MRVTWPATLEAGRIIHETVSVYVVRFAPLCKDIFFSYKIGPSHSGPIETSSSLSNTIGFNSGGAHVESRPAQRIFLLRFFPGFHRSLEGNSQIVLWRIDPLLSSDTVNNNRFWATAV